MPSFPARFAVACLLLLVAGYQVRARSQSAPAVTSPREHFGSAIGDDYFLASYAQFEDYWTTIDAESERVRLVPIGSTTEGRTQWMAVVSSPDNLARLDRYRDIARRLALGDGLSYEEARLMAAEGKAIVCIAGGLHADEALGAQQLIELVYELARSDDPETLRVLRDVIVLVVHANPDGHALVADWYMRERDPRRRTLDGLPRLYQLYAGHDLNRDFYLVSQRETENISRVLYRDWFPQVVYDHHQPGPEGTVMYAPPFNGPFNYVLDPLVPAGVELFGAAMHARFAAERKAGVTMRGGSTYTMWWNGGLRTTAYFHNQIGLLTETIGGPTPGAIPFVAARQRPGVDLPAPIAPGPWRFRQSVDYSLTANRAVLDAASRYRETLLQDVYRMASTAIAQGGRDSWPVSPPGDPASRDLANRVPRAYVLPADQPDFPTAAKFVGSLLKSGVTVHRATAPFVAGGRRYPADSFVVRTAQAFRAHVLDMFEPQVHPDERPAPGLAPTPPYDIAGWTLALQMGVKFDRIRDAVSGPFERIEGAIPPRGVIGVGAAPAGYLLAHHQNDAFVVVNRLLAAGERVWWPVDRTIGGSAGTGAMYVAATPRAAAIIERAAAELGVSAVGVPAPPRGAALQIRPVRIGLWDRYGGAATSGWIRWILERFEFPFELVYARTLDAGSLADRFDVLVLPDEAVPARGRQPDLAAEYLAMSGTLSRERTLPRLRAFVEDGGTLVAIGDATGFVSAIGAPVTPAPTARIADRAEGPLPASQFFIPGSVLRVRVDNTVPLAYGFERDVDVMFDHSPAFAIEPGTRRTRRVAWFDDAPLRSGWARGQEHLSGAAAVVDGNVGAGRLVLFGPEITFRGQPHGTFKFLFNAIHLARAVAVETPD